MKWKLLVAATLAAGAFGAATESNAGPFDKLKKAAKKVEKAANDVRGAQEAVAGVASATGAAGSGSPAAPAPASLTSLTECSGLEISNVMVGTHGEYTFKQGLSTEKRSGFINRRSAEVTEGCILPSVRTGEVIYFEVDKAAYEAMGNSNDWEMQCVDSANPAAGEAKRPQPYKIDTLSWKDMMLHCGNSEGIQECASGSNADRGDAYGRKLEARGKLMMTAPTYGYHLEKAGGTKFYCQWYNKKSGKSLVAYQYTRMKT